MRCSYLLFLAGIFAVHAKLDSDEDGDSIDVDLDDSPEHQGPAVTQIYRHPYTATILKNDTYICSSVILNTYWLLALSKCFDSDVISSYVTHKRLANYTVRVGSSYNNKGGVIYKIKELINNFDMKVSAMKLETPMEFNSRVNSVSLPEPDEGVSLGYLSTMVAWTPIGHMRVVNAPLINADICESYTKILPGHYICVGGVPDPNRNFCRKDNGGPVVQNGTLIAITSFLHQCAVYSRPHAFPRVASISRWLNSVIWDEITRSTSLSSSTQNTSNVATSVTTDSSLEQTETTSDPMIDPRRYMMTLPYDPVNVPLEPAGDNSVIPRMSLYESYLKSLAKARTSTTADPTAAVPDDVKRLWMQRYIQSRMFQNNKKDDMYEYN